MNVGVDPTRGDNLALTGDHFSRGTNHQFRINAGHRIRVACFAHFDNAPILNADITLDNAPVVDNQRIGNDKVEHPLIARGPATLPHPIADHLAATKGNLIAIDSEIFFNFDDQFGVGQPDAVAGGRAIEIGIGLPWNLERHAACSFAAVVDSSCNLPCTSPRWPRATRLPASATSVTSLASPGSKRTAVPAATLRRIP